jgi:ketosteroid isomerase-like protein
MSNLESRIQRLEDERDIQHTMYCYGAALDYGSETEWMNCWAPDAVLHWFNPPFRGPDQILAAFRSHTHAPQILHKHFLVNPRISVSDDTASADSLFARLDTYPEGPQILAFGRYLDKFVRCSDRRWRFSERIAEVECVRAPPEAVMKFMAAQKG